jgi:superfamily I DNA/RNA helicase
VRFEAPLWTVGSPARARALPASSAIPASGRRPRVRSLALEVAKGLEFDLVVLVDPAAFGGGIEGVVDRYVAMTRAAQELAILTP